jgi:hypothetical protein
LVIHDVPPRLFVAGIDKGVSPITVPSLEVLLASYFSGLPVRASLSPPLGGVKKITRGCWVRWVTAVISVRYLQGVKKRTVRFFTAAFREVFQFFPRTF